MLCGVSDNEGSKDAKNMESIKAVSSVEHLVVQQAPPQTNSIQNESPVSKSIPSNSVPQQIEQNVVTTPKSEENNFVDDNKNIVSEGNVVPAKPVEKNEEAVEQSHIIKSPTATLASTESNQEVNTSKVPTCALSVPNVSVEASTEEDQQKQIKEADTNNQTASIENNANNINKEIRVDSANTKEIATNDNMLEETNQRASQMQNASSDKTVEENKVDITEVNPKNLDDSEERSQTDEKSQAIGDSNASSSRTPEEAVVDHKSNEKHEIQNLSDSISKTENASAFTTEMNLNIASSVSSSEEQNQNDPKNETTNNKASVTGRNENVMVVQPKKIYVEKSSTVIQVMDATSAEYVKVGEKTPSASESESGNSDNNEYEFVDAAEFVASQFSNAVSVEKNAHRNSVSTLNIVLVNHDESRNQNETPKVADTNEAAEENSSAKNKLDEAKVEEAAPEIDNKFKAVLVPVDKPHGTKLSRKQKKSMRELQKIARERAKTKLYSQLSTSSSESTSGAATDSNDVKAASKDASSEALSLDATTEKPNEKPVKTTTVVQVAQNSSKTVPPKRPSKIPISRQRSVPKTEQKSPEQTPSKIPIKISTPKTPETPKLIHAGDVTPQFTNFACIVLKPCVQPQRATIRSQRSEEIASEMENSVQIVKELNRKFSSIVQNRPLSKKSSLDSTTSSKQLSYTKSLDNDSDSSVSDSNVDEILERSSDEDSYEEFGEYDEEVAESDTEDYNNFEKENMRAATELNINLSQISEKVNELTSNLNENEKHLNYKKLNSYIEETCESSEDYLSEEELEEDEELEEASEEDVKDLTEKLSVEIKQPTELELMQVK